MRLVLGMLGACALVVTILGDDPLPDFQLKDVSYASPRRNSTVSPRDYLMQVSAYYFGDAI